MSTHGEMAVGSASGPRRDHALDLLRAIALARVVLWHLYARTWMTWFAAIPIMFFVAGTLLAGPRAGTHRTFLARRARRLLLPLWFYGAVVAVGSLALGGARSASGDPFLRSLTWVVPLVDPRSPAWTGGWLSSHLWYLRAYLWILLLSPLLVRAARRIGRTLCAAAVGVVLLGLGGAGGAAGSVPQVATGTARVLLGDIIVYGLFATLGIWYARGGCRMPTRTRWIGAAGAGAAAVAFAAIAGLPTGGVNASYPAILLTGLAWLLAIGALQAPLRRFADRPAIARLSRRVSSRSLTVYLWHPLCIAAATRVMPGVGIVRDVLRLVVTVVLICIAVRLTGWVEELAAAARAPERVTRARWLGTASTVSTVAVGATVALIGGAQLSAASAGTSVTSSIAIGIPAPSSRAALSDSAFSPTTPPTTTAPKRSAATPTPPSTTPPTTTPPTTTPPKRTATTAQAMQSWRSSGASPFAGTRQASTRIVSSKAAPSATIRSTVARTIAPTSATVTATTIAAPLGATAATATQTTQATVAASTAGAPTTTRPASPLAAERLQQALDAWRTAQQPTISSVIVSLRRGDQSWTASSTAVNATPRYQPDQPFAAASITKTFTAALILRAVERGALSLDGDVPAVRGLTVPVPSGLTVRRLLSHTSGLVDYSLAPGWSPDATLTPLDAVTLSLRTPLSADAGTVVQYANANYLYLGLLLEQIEGRPYATLVDELATAAGLHDTHVSAPARPGWVGFSSGGIVSTAADLARWGQALFTPGRILGPSGMAALTTIGEANVALGAWPACPCSTDAQGIKRYTAIGHHTADGGMFTFPADNVTVVAMFEPTGGDTHSRIVALERALVDAIS